MKRIGFLSKWYERPTTRAVILILLVALSAAFIVAVSEGRDNVQFRSIGDILWWVMVTMSTVGYGDMVPVTPAGRLVAVVIMFVGVALLSVVTATISSILVTRKIKEGKGLQDIRLKNHVLLCGWNRQGEQILSTLEQSAAMKEAVVLINQLSEEDVSDIMARHGGLNIKYVRGDFTREIILNRANVKNAVSAIILPDTSNGSMKPGDERTILATLSIKTLNPKLRVYAHITDRENLSHLRKAKADEVIVSDAYTGYLLANYVVSPGIPQFVDQLFSEGSAFKLRRRVIPDELIGSHYSDLQRYYQEKHQGVLLGLGQMTEPFNLSELLSDDYSYLDAYIVRKFQEAGRGVDSEEQVKILVNPARETELKKNDFYISIESDTL